MGGLSWRRCLHDDFRLLPLRDTFALSVSGVPDIHIPALHVLGLPSTRMRSAAVCLYPESVSYSPIPWMDTVISFTYRPVQLHAIALGLFAAAIAPFGGFFASGAKRAFHIKDFANLFPGHGGVTDRVDCQLLMAVFTFVYVINFVQVNFVGSPDVGKVMSFVAELSTNEQVQLMTEIYTRLRRRGVGEDVLNITALLST